MSKIKALEETINEYGMQIADLSIRVNELEEMLDKNETICEHIQERVNDAEGYLVQLIWAIDGMERLIHEGTTPCPDDGMHTLMDVNTTIMKLHSITMLLGDIRKVE